jgi:hypothetical protein
MSSDPELERLLREARETLPGPDAASSERARGLALRAIRRRPRRLRVAALLGVTLAVAVGLGVGLGAFVAPRGEASKGPVGLGFLPQPGWFSLQAPTRSPSDLPAVAMVANVPFAPEDAVNGLAEPSALPYSTLLGLPPEGIVIVASFIARSEEPWALARYPSRQLPLSIRTATPFIEFGTQVRPEEPLGQYQLRAAVKGQQVDLQIYFGAHRPGPKRLAEAQRQLEELVVRSAPSAEIETAARPASPTTPSAPAVVDRTMRCTTAPSGGIREVETRANAGIRQGNGWKQLPYAVASSGNVGSTLDPLGDALAWMTAGRPAADTTVDWGFRTAQVSRWGTLAVSRAACRRVSAKVPLSRAGLEGGAVSPFGEKLDCPAPRRVLVHVRGLAIAKTELRRRGAFLGTNVPMKSGRLAVTTEKGRPILYADVTESGVARLFTARECVFD